MHLQEVLSIGHEEALGGVPRLAAGCLSETATFETSQFSSVAFLDKGLDKTPVGEELRVRKRYSRGWGPETLRSREPARPETLRSRRRLRP